MPFVQLGAHRVPTSTDARLHAATALRILGLEDAAWADLARTHHLPDEPRDFGAGPEATLSLQDFLRVAVTTPTRQGRAWQARALDTLARALSGDVHLAADIAERNPSPQERHWLSARLENAEARKSLMNAIARSGGSGAVFGQIGSVSNRSVLGTDSATIRRERGVKHTRDGLTTGELMRLTYLETLTARDLDAGRAHGNDAILDLHRRNAQRERLAWDHTQPTAPVLQQRAS